MVSCAACGCSQTPKNNSLGITVHALPHEILNITQKMANLVEDDRELCKNSIKYLHNMSLLPEMNVPALKSFYSTKRRLMELRKNILLPSNFTRTSITCQRCLINLRDGPATYQVIASKKQTKFAKKVQAKVQSGKALTKYQQNYSQKLNHFSGNQLAITCKFCKNEAFIKMEKPKKHVKQKVNTSIRLKRKKKRDKFCGLKEEAVLSLTSKNKNIGSETVGTVKKKKKLNLQEFSSGVQSLTPQNIRSLDNLGYTKHKRPRMKLKKAEVVKISEISKENLSKNKHNLKKKKQKLNKLNDILKKQNTVNNSVSSLKQFLQGL